MKNSEMEQDILKVLVTEEEIHSRVQELGAELYRRFEGKKPLFLGVRKGAPTRTLPFPPGGSRLSTTSSRISLAGT